MLAAADGAEQEERLDARAAQEELLHVRHQPFGRKKVLQGHQLLLRRRRRRLPASGFRIRRLGFGVWGLGFRYYFRVQGLVRVQWEISCDVARGHIVEVT
jgi:hypothetical protein